MGSEAAGYLPQHAHFRLQVACHSPPHGLAQQGFLRGDRGPRAPQCPAGQGKVVTVDSCVHGGQRLSGHDWPVRSKGNCHSCLQAAPFKASDATTCLCSCLGCETGGAKGQGGVGGNCLWQLVCSSQVQLPQALPSSCVCFEKHAKTITERQKEACQKQPSNIRAPFACRSCKSSGDKILSQQQLMTPVAKAASGQRWQCNGRHTLRSALEGKARPGFALSCPSLASMMSRSDRRCSGLVTATTPASLRASSADGPDKC